MSVRRTRCSRCWRQAIYEVPIYGCMTDQERFDWAAGRAEPKRWEWWCQKHYDQHFAFGNEYAWPQP